MGTIKAAVQAEDNEFISLHELLESLQTIEDCTLHEATRFLTLKLRAVSEAPRFFHFSPNTGVREVSSSDKRPVVLLDEILHIGKYLDSYLVDIDTEEDLRADIDSESQYFSYGFRRSEIARFLQGKGIILASSGKAEIQPAKPVPEWANRLKPIKEFFLFQAASVLLGRDPFFGVDINWHQDSAFVAYV